MGTADELSRSFVQVPLLTFYYFKDQFMLQDAFPDTLTYHLSKLVTYPFNDSPVTAGGVADAQAVLDAVNEFERRLNERTDHSGSHIYDIDSVRHSLTQLMVFFDREKSSNLNQHEAYALGYLVRGRVRDYADAAAEIDAST